MKIIVGVTGASGAIYAVRLLEFFRKMNIETHLVVTKAGEKTIKLETGINKDELVELATHSYQVDDLTSRISSGSFYTDAMVVIPCSMKTIAGISNGYSSNLLLRAADVTLKERRPLVLVPRETPMNLIHLENLSKVARAGAIVLPAMPGFYHKPKSMDDLVNHIVGKVLDTLHLEHELYKRWEPTDIY
jgi:4-hydroxy-3-polyprenylbenzoate decarboxylase